MALLPPVRRLAREDFPDQASWIGKLIFSLNAFMDSVVVAINGGLTLADNTQSQVIQNIRIAKGQTGAQSLKVTLARPIVGAWIVRAYNTDTPPTALTAMPVLNWHTAQQKDNTPVFVIDSIGGLDPTRGYSISIVLTCG